MPVIDGFPYQPGDPDSDIQSLIDSDLAVWDELDSAFERTYPYAPGIGSDRMLERIRYAPRPDALFPNLFASASRREWFLPMLRRFGWHRQKSDARKRWMQALAKMFRLVLDKINALPEPEFLAFAAEVEALNAHGTVMAIDSVAHFTRSLEKAGPLSPAVVEAIRSLVTLPPGSRASEREDHFVWPLFHAATWYAEDDPCWSARVRRDLDAVEPKLRAHWFKVFDHTPSNGPLSRPSLSALKKLGDAHVEQCLRRWVAMLSEGPGPVLSRMGKLVLRQFLYICEAAGGALGDQLLYEVARAPWAPGQDSLWLWHFLHILEHRTDDRAFAMLEALAMNPATDSREVRRKYSALLTVFGAGALPTSIIGIDRYPLDRDPSLQEQQTRIDHLLRMAAEGAARGPYVYPEIAARIKALRASRDPHHQDLANALEAREQGPKTWFDPGPEVTATLKTMVDAILKEFSADPGKVHLAAAHRLEWIRQHSQEFSPNTVELWLRSFRGLGCEGGLMQRALQNVGQLPIEELLKAIDNGGGDLKVFELAKTYVAGHGWHQDLVAALRKWTSTFGASHTDHHYRSQVEWFLWFETVNPIQLDDCWSHRVKRDLRNMSSEERAGWIPLFDNNTLIVADRPPRKWVKAAEATFPKLDPAAFRSRFVAWFAPFAKSEPLRLTITGRNVLRLLMWYALIAKDPVVDQALAGFVHAKWKTREVEKRVAQAEMAFSYVLAERAPQVAFPILEAWVASGRAYQGSSGHKAYRELCTRLGRTPVNAIPEKTRPVKLPQMPNSNAVILQKPVNR